MIQKQGNWAPYELKPRDVERRFFTCLRTADSKITEKRFSASDCDWRSGYSMTTPRRKNITLSPVNINTTAERSWFEDHALYLVGPKRSLLWAVEIWRSITGDQYRLQLIRLSRLLREKRPEYQQRHDKIILLHDNARLHVAKIKNIWKRSNGMLSHILRTLLLLIVPKDAASH